MLYPRKRATGTSKPKGPKSLYRSGFEARVAQDLEARGITAEYEKLVLPFIPPPRKYKVDWVLSNGIAVEAKGYFTSDDRTKMLCVKNQHPDRDIRILFQDATKRLSKISKTTYAQWADKNGFSWAERTIPDNWLT